MREHSRSVREDSSMGPLKRRHVLAAREKSHAARNVGRLSVVGRPLPAERLRQSERTVGWTRALGGRSRIWLELPEGVCFSKSDLSNERCPNCRSTGLSVFYTVKDVPMHSCLLVSSQEEALTYPRGDLQLGFCRACGFIANTSFDGAANNYCTEYEETQGFSPRFRAFAKSLAERWIEKYDIRNKRILEIGCGKGEFLALMCELGDNRGIGIDPAYVPERNPSCAAGQIEFIQDFYSDAYADVESDVMCCRHTLEHIAPTYTFIDMIRRAIGDRKDVLVLFEVPDVMRVLSEGAFWDMYYEHCTYFSAGSLARLFRACGFELDDLYLDYDGQYIILAAYPGERSIRPAFELENDLGELSKAYGAFGQTCSDRIVQWRNTIGELMADGQRMVLWGSGSKAVSFLTTLGLTDEIEYVVDINPYKQGRFSLGTGQEIVSPEFLTRYRPDNVIVMNPIYCDEIKRDLDRLGIRADLLAL
jgi:hypothetical protein